jgi:hypothetical protein
VTRHYVTTRHFALSDSHRGRQILVDGKPQHAIAWIPRTADHGYKLHIRRHPQQQHPDCYEFDSFYDLCQYIRDEFEQDQASLC